MYISTVPFRAYIELWKAQRGLAKHAGESAIRFYAFRIFTAFTCLILYLIFQVGTPMLIILADRTWPNMSSAIVGSILLFLIVCGFFLGFYISKAADFIILKFELRNPFPEP
jgi:uncharacterized RDD family membrane protein YckC